MNAPRAWATIDTAAIQHNTRLLDEAAGAAEVCAVVKANGYGHGAERVAAAALKAGATRLAVAQVQEGQALRLAGISAPIMVLSEPGPAEYSVAADHSLEVTVYTDQGVTAAKKLGLAVHVKVDTGMHRSGCAPSDVMKIVSDANPRSVWTHLAVADEVGNPYTSLQLERYESVLASLAAAGVQIPLRHAANTAACLLVPAARYDMVRCGIGIYGLAPSATQLGQFDLRPALRLETTVALTKRLRAGDRVSYGLRGEVDVDTTVATLPIGYADGVRRSLWRNGTVLVGGKHRRILGVVTMDQLVIDCGDDAVSIGDEAVLIGKQGDAVISADDWARWLDTINYEIVCGITDRVGRRDSRVE